MDSKQPPAESRRIIIVEHECREIQFECFGHAPEEEDHFLNAVVDFLLEIRSKEDRIDSEPIMREKTWLPPKPKEPPKPKVPDHLRESIEKQAAPVVAKLKKRYCKKPKNPKFNWPHDFFTRWHRDGLYFVVLMRTGHDLPPEFETHAARMQHVGNDRFDLAVPMRRGWNTFLQNAAPEECLKEISESICF